MTLVEPPTHLLQAAPLTWSALREFLDDSAGAPVVILRHDGAPLGAAPHVELSEQQFVLAQLQTAGQVCIAALSGSADAAVFSIALAADVRIASPDLTFADQNIDHVLSIAGVSAEAAQAGGATWWLAAGHEVTAADALAAGLVDRIGADPHVRAHELAVALASVPRGTLAEFKAQLRDGSSEGDRRRHEREAHARLHADGD